MLSHDRSVISYFSPNTHRLVTDFQGTDNPALFFNPVDINNTHYTGRTLDGSVCLWRTSSTIYGEAIFIICTRYIKKWREQKWKYNYLREMRPLKGAPQIWAMLAVVLLWTNTIYCLANVASKNSTKLLHWLYTILFGTWSVNWAEVVEKTEVSSVMSITASPRLFVSDGSRKSNTWQFFFFSRKASSKILKVDLWQRNVV